MTPTAQQLEALLFLSSEAVQKRKLVKQLSVELEELTEAIGELSEHLTGHGVALIETEHDVQLVTSPEVAAFAEQFIATTTESLSAAAAETLAVIAYRGPITAEAITEIRGVDSHRMLQQLQSRELIQATGSNTPTYSVTTGALAALGVAKPQDLPDFERLSSDEQLRQSLDTTAS